MSDQTIKERLERYDSKERSIKELSKGNEASTSELADIAAEIQARDNVEALSGEGSFVAAQDGDRQVLRLLATEEGSLAEARKVLASPDGAIEFDAVEYEDEELALERFAERFDLPTPPGLPGRNPADPLSEIERATKQLTDAVSEITQNTRQSGQ